MSLVFTYSSWWLLAGLILAIGLSTLLYFRDEKLSELKKSMIRLLFGLRTLFIFAIIFLLLGPEVKFSKSETQKPVFVILQDNSASIPMNRDSSYYHDEYVSDLAVFVEKLSEKFDVKTMLYGDSVREASEIDFSDKLTNMSGLSDAIELRYSRESLGGVLLASDGLYNQGMNPLNQLSGLSVPVFSLALGDTLQQKDALISDLNYNQLAFYRNSFPVRVYYEAFDAENETLLIEIKQDNNIIARKTIEISKNSARGHSDFEIEANQLGLQAYEIEIQPLDQEISLKNNKGLMLINVIDNQQEVLLLGRAPHPDLGAIRRALEQNLNYSVRLHMANELPLDFTDTDLVILHDLPAAQYPVSKLISDMNRRKMPILFVFGQNTDIQTFNQIGMPIQVQLRGGSFDNAQAVFNQQFDLFDIPQNLLNGLDRMPPLSVPFASIRLQDAYDVPFNQRISGVETDNPLLTFMQYDNRKIAVLTGSGIWRWRISDFKLNGNHNAFDEFINKSIQYLITKSSGEQFAVSVGQMFTNNETVVFQAELYNDAWELVNNPEVSLSIEDSLGQKLAYVMNRGMNAYRLNLGNLAAGEYSWIAETSFQGNNFTEIGTFIVRDISVEGLKTRANHQLLSMIANRTNGELIYPNKLSAFSEILLTKDISKSRVFTKTTRASLLNLKWIFFLILSWISLEWFLRKFWGSY
ncbi:MAG: hypothetical protein U9N51_07830 [Bacteroidota bacterium]|nr:hypothetical protein [Bacteroidota bacterium]